MRFNERQLHELGISKADLATLRRILDFTNGVGGLVAKAGGGQAGATRLSIHVNEIGTVATAGDSVILPPAGSGLVVTIINNGASACDVFPGADGDLGSGTNTAASLAPAAKITYHAYDDTNWR